MASRLASVDLLLTDLVMPEMSGAKLAEQLRSTHPDLPVLYTSGYVAIPAELTHDAVVVSKPFTRKALMTAVGRALQPADETSSHAIGASY